MILRNKQIALWVLFLSLILAAGCQTMQGVSTGVACTVEGAAKDTVGIWQGILQIDSWIRDNLW